MVAHAGEMDIERRVGLLEGGGSEGRADFKMIWDCVKKTKKREYPHRDNGVIHLKLILLKTSFLRVSEKIFFIGKLCHRGTWGFWAGWMADRHRQLLQLM